MNILPQFSAPVLSIQGLRTKFDTAIVSNSLVVLIGDFIEARIVQQLHYWTFQEYGVVLKDRRWIFKPICEWMEEVMIGFSSWQVRKAIASLTKKDLVFREQLHKEHYGHNYNPKNRTYYYSLNYEKLDELASEQRSPETIESDSFADTAKQFCREIKDRFCESAKNKTENTSIEHVPQPPYRGESDRISELKPRPEQVQDNSPPPGKSNKPERLTVTPPVKVESSEELINESTKRKFAELKIPLSRRVRKAIASHHESQVLAILSRIYSGFESIKNPEDFFCTKISEEKVEHLGAVGLEVSAKMAAENKEIDANRADLDFVKSLADASPFLRNRRKPKQKRGFG